MFEGVASDMEEWVAADDVRGVIDCRYCFV